MKILCISNTHEFHYQLTILKEPKALIDFSPFNDINMIIYAGDVSSSGLTSQGVFFYYLVHNS